jgi:uncharacterized protein involved in exopolysaccharide biosynthesis
MEWLQVDGKEIPLLEAPQKYEAPPRRIAYVLFKQKRLIAAIFLVISLPVFLYIFTRPTEYIATARVLIKPSRGFLNLSPTGGTGGGESLRVAPSPEVINNEIQIIKSPELAARLAKEIPFPDDPNGKQRGEAEIEQDARRIRGYVKAAPIRTTNLIQISVTSPFEQEWAANVVNRAAELYMEQHLKVHKTPGIEDFYDEQEKKLRTELLKSEETLKSFQEREKIIDAPEEVLSDLRALATFESSLKQTDSSIQETEQTIAVLDDQLKQQKATISSATSITENPVYMQIRNRLTQLELERDGLLQRYTPEDRMVKDKQKEIDDLKKKLETVKPTSVGSESISLNDVHRRILNELLGARVRLRALNEKKAALTRQVESYSTTAADKKRKGFEYDRLLRDVNAKKESLDLYKKRAEEARISDAMDERKFSNAYILERASLPLPRAGYSPALLALITLILSTGAAIAAAFGVEYFNSTLRNESDIEDQIGLPVLATIQNHGDFNPAPSK